MNNGGSVKPRGFMRPVSHAAPKALRSIALFEAAKGFVVLLAGFGLLSFRGGQADMLAEQLVRRLHLNPAQHYPQIFIHALADVNDTQLVMFAGFAALYAAVRFTEAYGLWRARPWAAWLAALSGAIYVPFEFYEIAQGLTWLKVTALAANLAIVLYLARVLFIPRRPLARAT